MRLQIGLLTLIIATIFGLPSIASAKKITCGGYYVADDELRNTLTPVRTDSEDDRFSVNEQDGTISYVIEEVKDDGFLSESVYGYLLVTVSANDPDRHPIEVSLVDLDGDVIASDISSRKAHLRRERFDVGGLEVLTNVWCRL